MFGFDRDEDGSERRYVADVDQARWLQRFRGRRRAVLRHRLWWVIHNCVAHPLIGLFPFRPLFSFHDWTSRRMHP